MEPERVRSLLDVVRDASPTEVVVASVFLLPMPLGAWSLLFGNIGYIDNHDGWKAATLAVLAGVYVLAVVAMKCSDSRDHQFRRARLHVVHRVEVRSGHRASYAAIREEVNERYTDEFLSELVEKSPDFRGQLT